MHCITWIHSLLTVIIVLLDLSDAERLFIRVNDRLAVYADGSLLPGTYNGGSGQYVYAPDNTEVYAILGENSFGDGRTLTFFSDWGEVSDVTWKCTHVEHVGWQLPGFDDSNWTQAEQVSVYGELPADYPYGPVFTIWTDQSDAIHQIAYCRKNTTARKPFRLQNSGLGSWVFGTVIKPSFLVEATRLVENINCPMCEQLAELCALSCIALEACDYFTFMSDKSTPKCQFYKI